MNLAHLADGQGSRRLGRPQIGRGTVVRQPATAGDVLFVSLNNYSPAYPWEVQPGAWTPNGGMPTAGTTCLVIFDDLGDPWVPLIQPTGLPVLVHFDTLFAAAHSSSTRLALSVPSSGITLALLAVAARAASTLTLSAGAGGSAPGPVTPPVLS